MNIVFYSFQLNVLLTASYSLSPNTERIETYSPLFSPNTLGGNASSTSTQTSMICIYHMHAHTKRQSDDAHSAGRTSCVSGSDDNTSNLAYINKERFTGHATLIDSV